MPSIVLETSCASEIIKNFHDQGCQYTENGILCVYVCVYVCVCVCVFVCFVFVVFVKAHSDRIG